MSWELEFDSQWQIFLDIVETRIRKKIDRNKKLDSELINSIIRSEVNKWSTRSHYNGAWLENLKRKHPSLGEEFQSALQRLRLSNEIFFNCDQSIVPFSKIVVFALPIVFVLFLVLEMGMKLLLGMAVVTFVAFPIFSSLETKQREKVVDNLVEQIRKEFETTEQKLRNIAERADWDYL